MLKNVWIKISAAAIFSLFTFACGANEGILKSGKADPNAANAVRQIPTIERDIADMATADFALIFVLRRKDGGKMDAADRTVIREATTGANRRVGSDSDTAFVIGTNQPITPENMARLSERFAIQLISSPPAASPANSANVTK